MINYKNNRIVICKEVQAPAEAVWGVFTDTHLWPIWGPSLVDVDCKHRHIKLGCEGRVKTLFSFWLPFTITEYRHMDFWSWRVGSWEATGHKIIPTNDNSCKVCFDISWWCAVYLPVCWFALSRINKIATTQKMSP